jgi:very-short-patch-repair endonuclease
VLISNRYIVDFLAPSILLVVEVDGAYHVRRGVADARRDRYLTRLGYRVLRLDADLVIAWLAEAVERVRDAVS